jgi:hypothetical protein
MDERLRVCVVPLHEQLHNFNSQTITSMPSSLVSFSENQLSQSRTCGEAAKMLLSPAHEVVF